MKTFWKIIGKYRRKPCSDCPITKEEWQEFYAAAYPPRENIDRPIEERNNPTLEREITYGEVCEAIKRIKTNKSPGPDGISNGFYKGLPDNWTYYMTRLFNKILETGETPHDWSNSEIVMFFKKGEPQDPGNYRGIALANALSKIFTSILATRINEWSEAEQILPEGQAGFRRGRGCDDNIFVLNAQTALALKNPKGKLYAVFVDFRRAFDSVDHLILWSKLQEMGVGARIIRVLRD